MRTRSDRLTERQKNIMAFIQKHIDRHGFPPTIREIGEATGIASTSVVNYNLNKLSRLGHLDRTSTKSRGIRILTEKAAPTRAITAAFTMKVAYAGQIIAGQPLAIPDDNDFLNDENSAVEVVPGMLGGADPSEVFALRVHGDSMIDAMIQEGDIVILRKTQNIRNGDMVAAWLVERGETTLKHLFREGENYRLQPAHPTMAPIIVRADCCEIQGKVVSVLRVMK